MEIFQGNVIYIIARSNWNRPTLQHQLIPGVLDRTLCGLDTKLWTMSFQVKVIPEIACLRCKMSNLGH